MLFLESGFNLVISKNSLPPISKACRMPPKSSKQHPCFWLKSKSFRNTSKEPILHPAIFVYRHVRRKTFPLMGIARYNRWWLTICDRGHPVGVLKAMQAIPIGLLRISAVCCVLIYELGIICTGGLTGCLLFIHHNTLDAQNGLVKCVWDRIILRVVHQPIVSAYVVLAHTTKSNKGCLKPDVQAASPSEVLTYEGWYL